MKILFLVTPNFITVISVVKIFYIDLAGAKIKRINIVQITYAIWYGVICLKIVKHKIFMTQNIHNLKIFCVNLCYNKSIEY